MSYILDALKKNEAAKQPEVSADILLQRPARNQVPWYYWAIGAALLVNAILLAWFLLRPDGGSSRETQTPLTQPGASRAIVPTPREQRLPPARTPAPRPPAPSAEPARIASNLPQRVPQRAPQRPAPRSVAAPAPAAAQPPPAAAPSGGRVLTPEQAARLGIGLEDAVPAVAARPAVSAPSAPAATAAPRRSTSRSTQAITVAELPSGAREAFPKLEFSTHIFADDPSMRAIVVNERRLTEGETLGELVLRAVTEEGAVFGYRNHLVRVSVVDAWQ